MSFQSSLLSGATVKGTAFHFLQVSCLPFISTIKKFSILSTGNSRVLWIQITPRFAPHSLHMSFPHSWIDSSWYLDDPVLTNETWFAKCSSTTTWWEPSIFLTSSDQHIKWSHLMQRSSNWPVLISLRLDFPKDFNWRSRFASSWNFFISWQNLSG